MRDGRRLNALARSRLRARRAAEPRFAAARQDSSCPAAAAPRSGTSSHESNQSLVAILAPVLG